MAAKSGDGRFGAPADRKDFAAARGRWLDALARADLSDRTVRVGVIIGLRISHTSGWAWPSYASVAEDIGSRRAGNASRSAKTIERAVAELVRAGWLVRVRRAAPGISAGYTLDWQRWLRPAIPIGSGIDPGSVPF